jgi:uncharacterized alpha-E superfamily protein
VVDDWIERYRRRAEQRYRRLDAVLATMNEPGTGTDEPNMHRDCGHYDQDH